MGWVLDSLLSAVTKSKLEPLTPPTLPLSVPPKLSSLVPSFLSDIVVHSILSALWEEEREEEGERINFLELFLCDCWDLEQNYVPPSALAGKAPGILPHPLSLPSSLSLSSCLPHLTLT